MSDDVRTGGELAHDALVAAGVEVVFAVASVHNLPILQAAYNSGRIRVVNMRHEQNAVHAADGYARATGRLGVAVTSTGPGAANSMGGLFEAAFASSPVLEVTGQVETRFLGQGRGYLHEAENQREMLRSLTRETWSVRRTEDIGQAVLAAATAARSGRPQPVAVEIPVDLQYASTDVAPCDWSMPVPAEPAVRRLDEAADLLATAERPLIWAGGGVISGDASDAVLALAERLRIPVVTSTQGRGAIPEGHPLSLGALATVEPVRAMVEEADVVLAVGTRFQMYPTAFWTLRLPPALIHVDADASVIGRSYPARFAVTGDARRALLEIDGRVAHTRADPSWADRAEEAYAAARESGLQQIGPDHRGILEVIREHLPEAGAVVRDSTMPAYYWGDSLLPILRPRTSMNPSSGSIGPGLPLALGAAIGRDARSVVIHGDGGIMLSIQELATLAQFQIPLTVLVFDDGGYGILRNIQSATFGGPTHDVDLPSPDFVGLARSMHVDATRVGSVAEFTRAFVESVQGDGPYLIQIDQSKLTPMDVPPSPQELLG